MPQTSESIPPLELEFSLRVAVVGAVNVGKTQLVKQLLNQSALDNLFCSSSQEENTSNSNNNNDDDETECIVPPLPEKSSKTSLLPSIESLGVNFNCGTFSFDQEKVFQRQNASSSSSSSQRNNTSNIEKRSWRISIRFEFFEVGGASCCEHPYYFEKEKESLIQTVEKCDVVLAVYDLCNKATLYNLIDEVIPAIVSVKNKESSTSTTGAAPHIICVGNKMDLRKNGMSKEDKQKFGVFGQDQKALEAKLPRRNSILADSVAATTGIGMMRLRRELIHDALFVNKEMLMKTPVFFSTNISNQNLPPNLWKGLDEKISFLSKGISSREGKSSMFSTNNINQDGATTAAATTTTPITNNANNDPYVNENENGKEIPVISGSGKKVSEDEDDEEDNRPGVTCKLCGCVVQ